MRLLDNVQVYIPVLKWEKDVVGDSQSWPKKANSAQQPGHESDKSVGRPTPAFTAANSKL